VKRLTDDKMLKAEVRTSDDGGGDEQQRRRRQVILYDREINVNSLVAQKQVSFTADVKG